MQQKVSRFEPRKSFKEPSHRLHRIDLDPLSFYLLCIGGTPTHPMLDKDGRNINLSCNLYLVSDTTVLTTYTHPHSLKHATVTQKLMLPGYRWIDTNFRHI